MTITNLLTGVFTIVPLMVGQLMTLVDYFAVETVMPIVMIAISIIGVAFYACHVTGILEIAVAVLAWPAAFGLFLAWNLIRSRYVV